MIATDDIEPLRFENPGFEVELIDDYGPFFLYSKAEILPVLQSALQKNTLISAHFNHGQAYFLTSLIGFQSNNTEIILDVGGDERMNDRALKADKLIFTTFIDKVKIQFGLARLERKLFEGRPAFVGPLPEKLLRLQRREYYRLATPIANPIYLRTSIPPGQSVDIPLLDISGGGVGLMLPLELGSHVEIGQVLENCRITLPGEGIVTSALGVRNLFAVTTRSGTNYVRLGGEFVKLDASALRSIQRYIINVERERKALLNGLAGL